MTGIFYHPWVNESSKFRNFASSYGNMALNNIMNCHFPTVNSLEENLDRLVEIFGLYIVYCLIEASRLIAERL